MLLSKDKVKKDFAEIDVKGAKKNGWKEVKVKAEKEDDKK